MRELITQIVRALVDNQDAVEVVEVAGPRTVIVELKVAKEDMGKVIGRQGRTVDAIRTLLSAAARRSQKRSVLEIIESDVKTEPLPVE
jgi:predicted RNA-binding protein YlqC (UPF0109 family)